LLSVNVLRLNARTDVSHWEIRDRLLTIELRCGASCGSRDSNLLLAATPSRTGLPASKERILAKCDLPDPKYPEIQMPISVVFWRKVSV
jgi:hypothetical protein